MKKKLHFCTHKVNRSHIRRENRKGVEHIIIASFTLPPNIVMNGGLYPAEEIAKSFLSLNRTPVTVEHPEIDGMFVSANDPEIDFDFRFGAFNENAQKLDDGRISLDKVINVQKAMMTEKGKRLLDRIEELENNENARPIHTSVGVFVDVEELDEPKDEIDGVKTNSEYNWIARDMIFDHDAILLDSIGASTPDQGTGIGINKEQLKVSHYVVESPIDDRNAIPGSMKSKAASFHANKNVTFSKIFEELRRLINLNTDEDDHNWLLHESVDDDSFVFETQSGELFKSNYTVDDLGNIAIQDTRLPVERVVSFPPINTTDTEEDSAMRDTIIAELAKLGITVNTEITDAELTVELTKALTANKGDDTQDKNGNLAELLANAMKPLNDRFDKMETQLTANTDKELSELADFIVNSKQRPEFDVDGIKSLGVDKARAIASNCGFSNSIGSTMHINNSESDTFKTNVDDLPE